MTTIGRMTIFVLGIWGIFCVSLVVVTFSNMLEMDTSESRTYNLMNRLYSRKKAKHYATKVIQSIFLYKKQKKLNESHSQFYLVKIKKFLQKFSKISNRISNTYDPSSLYEMMITNFNVMKSEIKLIKANQDSIVKNLGIEPIKYEVHVSSEKKIVDDSSVSVEESLIVSEPKQIVYRESEENFLEGYDKIYSIF